MAQGPSSYITTSTEILATNLRCIFPVEISRTKAVCGLKKVIKEDPSNGDFNVVDAKYLDSRSLEGVVDANSFNGIDADPINLWILEVERLVFPDLLR